MPVQLQKEVVRLLRLGLVPRVAYAARQSERPAVKKVAVKVKRPLEPAQLAEPLEARRLSRLRRATLARPVLSPLFRPTPAPILLGGQ